MLFISGDLILVSFFFFLCVKNVYVSATVLTYSSTIDLCSSCRLIIVVRPAHVCARQGQLRVHVPHSLDPVRLETVFERVLPLGLRLQHCVAAVLRVHVRQRVRALSHTQCIVLVIESESLRTHHRQIAITTRSLRGPCPHRRVRRHASRAARAGPSERPGSRARAAARPPPRGSSS